MDSVGTPKRPQPLTGQRKEAYSGLAEFTLALIQAMLRTGYYASDHPEAQRSMSGLYEKFCELVEKRSELTYLIFEKRESQEIVVEGYTNIHLSLYEIMARGMADMFTPKFLDFFKRWSLLSFSIKAESSEEDFNKFIELMSAVPTAGTGASGSERLTQELADNNILHISTVFKHEMVGRERHLPWRVRLALSRLRRDLRALPLYKKATPEVLTRIKLQIIDDVIRPVRTPELLKDFLVNYDLIAADITVLEESDVESEICQNLRDYLLVSTGSEIVSAIQKMAEYGSETFPWGENVAEVKARHIDALRDLATTLFGRGSVLEHDFVEALVDQQVLKMDELPPELRHIVETRHLADAFLARKDQYLEYLRNPKAGEATQKLAATIYRITPDLLLRGEFESVTQILDIVHEGEKEPTTERFFEQLSAYILKAASAKNVMAHLLAELGIREKEERNRLVTILAFIGEEAVSGLLGVYDEAQDKSVRLSVFDTLRSMGPKALKPFLERLNVVESDWAIARHALNEVAESGDPALAKSCRAFLKRPNPHVRQAALRALYKLNGAAAEEHFLNALSDEEAEVRQTAVSCLRGISSRHPEALDFYNQLLNPEDTAEQPDTDGVLIEVCRALAGLADSKLDAEMAQEILLAAIRPVKAKGVLSKLKKAALRYSETVEQAALEALGVVGTMNAIERIQELVVADEALAVAAASAIDRITERAAQPSSTHT
jgi:HEAT repeat protein